MAEKLHQRKSVSTLVCVFLRGGADGLHLVVPYAEERYYSLRPSLALARPDDARASEDRRSLRLDDRFALHPALAPLLPIWRERKLSIVHAVGSDDRTRSHFEAQDRMEDAGAAGHTEGSGWIARHIRSRAGAPAHSMTAVSLGCRPTESLRGIPTSAISSLADYTVGADAEMIEALSSLHAVEHAPSAAEEVCRAGRDTIGTVRRLERIQGEIAQKGAYPAGKFGDSMRELARLIRADVGLEVATVDSDGWDSHFTQHGVIAGPARELAEGLVAFRADLGERLQHVVLVVMTEFGRRAYENTSLGTDHGRGGVMFAMGGGVRGGRVVTDWPGLGEGDLEPPGDLRVTIDYRDILRELLESGLGNTNAAEVFPGHEYRRRGAVSG